MILDKPVITLILINLIKWFFSMVPSPIPYFALSWSQPEGSVVVIWDKIANQILHIQRKAIFCLPHFCIFAERHILNAWLNGCWTTCQYWKAKEIVLSQPTIHVILLQAFLSGNSTFLHTVPVNNSALFLTRCSWEKKGIPFM